MNEEDLKNIAIAIFLFIAPVASLCVSIGLGLLVGAWAGFFAMTAFLLVLAAVLVVGYKRGKKEESKEG